MDSSKDCSFEAASAKNAFIFDSKRSLAMLLAPATREPSFLTVSASLSISLAETVASKNETATALFNSSNSCNSKFVKSSPYMSLTISTMKSSNDASLEESLIPFSLASASRPKPSACPLEVLPLRWLPTAKIAASKHFQVLDVYRDTQVVWMIFSGRIQLSQASSKRLMKSQHCSRCWNWGMVEVHRTYRAGTCSCSAGSLEDNTRVTSSLLGAAFSNASTASGLNTLLSNCFIASSITSKAGIRFKTIASSLWRLLSSIC
mmetsp:Transcript_46019/g.90707  ORF Transcript_46019/g.90707 Transcript_46019/m.90707 type:complete len:262 (+) Transcript_46019:2131-2916(+)